MDKFRPERWFDKDGQVRNIPEYIPFSIGKFGEFINRWSVITFLTNSNFPLFSNTLGKRACPGEQLARTELFIDTVALLLKFTFQAEDPKNPPKVQGTAGATFSPKPFKIVAVPH